MFKKFVAMALPLSYFSFKKQEASMRSSALFENVEKDLELDVAKLKVETQEFQKMKIFGLSGGKELANEIAFHLGTRLGKLNHYENDSGESILSLKETVRGNHVFIIQSLCDPVNSNIMELLFTITLMKRVSANKITLVIPYLAYNRQSDVSISQRRGSLFFFDIAKMLEECGADNIITINLHHPSTSGGFKVPLLEIDSTGLCVPYFEKKKHQLKDLVIVGADERLVSRVLALKEAFQEKGIQTTAGSCVRHPQTPKPEYIGQDVAGKDVLLVDDIIDTGGTSAKLASFLKARGARDVYMFATHGLWSKDATEIIDDSDLKEVVTTNTITIPPHKTAQKIFQVSVGRLLAQAILKVHFNKIENETSLENLYNFR